MTDNELKVKKQKERSTPYPSITLKDAIVYIEALKKALGKGPYSRESIAQALGHDKLSGPAARKVAALGHYGLVNRNGDVYTMSQLAEDILHPITDEQKIAAIVKAAISPALFTKLIHQFKNQALPSRLDSILLRQGVSSGAAREVVTIFTDTLKFAGLLQNGVVATDFSKVQAIPAKSDALQEEITVVGVSAGQQTYNFNDTGAGWSVTIKSGQPLNSKIKNELAAIGDLLSELNKEESQ
ncbi:MAG: hypothetical protein A2756_05025 [Candidatus Ryanbacteria bacterium RIFCSPHIGHO2_01_FULL_48_27]|uniref:Uncharacterized protein n=1 Tax=Candidatus Ryanbacteria bacterium RIFCSPHIGHO2_01_FULL_48_27 TaxID=1802115 RepID=A0A1G2G1R3_9BACT|nr:MAG: hypothetical protein A2756_05025 [Candidatus Ryanbacteria bacterium RIFCSPHIGHO2_01_FULL_48_27]